MKRVHPRQQVEAAIEHLLDLLDDIDGDPDAEPEETDYDLAGATSDLEEDISDNEPSLGWCEGIAQGQGRWGGSDDRELGLEPIVTADDRRTYFRSRYGNIGR